MIRIDKRSGVPIYKQVFEAVRAQILRGELSPGDQLVSVRELAGKLEINPMTISKAYSRLEQEGLVFRRPGLGSFVAEQSKRSRDEALQVTLETPFKNAASAAHSSGLSEDDACKLFREHFRKCSPPKKSSKKRSKK